MAYLLMKGTCQHESLVSAYYHGVYPFEALNNVYPGGSVDSPDELQQGDILVVHGGEDISPSLYNRNLSFHTDARPWPSKRDTIEWNLMKRTLELDVPIIGLCRGAQMLCALAGGSLVQHIENHCGSHTVCTKDGKEFNVNSIHHQMMFPWEEGVSYDIIAWSKHKLSDIYYDENNIIDVDMEPEYIYFPQHKGFAIQWHPEMMDAEVEATKYLLNHINKELGND